MKRKGKASAAFAKIAAGLDDAIENHRGTRKLTVRDVELKGPKAASLASDQLPR
jgi:hypothetical protein